MLTGAMSDISLNRLDGAEPTPVRRLAAVMFADVVGYTAMTARDEIGVLKLWTRYLDTVLGPEMAAHGGAVVRTLGDGVLAVFSSVVAAVACAEALQAPLAAKEAARRWPGLTLRVAVNLCDVYMMPGDIHGDGVNIAKRLQEHAAPGAVILSETACEAVRGEVGGRLRDLGFVALKGAAAPVRAFELVGRDGPGRGLAATEGELPSIAILPFATPAGREDDGYFADGVVEDVITSLSNLSEFCVIARSSTLAFRNRQMDPREARRVFGVRYVMQGMVRRQGHRIRLTATLVDCESGATLMSSRRDSHEDGLFEAQDALVEEIVANIAPHIRRAELARALRKPPEVFSAYDLLLRALEAMQTVRYETYAQAAGFLDAAAAADPRFAAPLAWKTLWRAVMVAQRWSQADRAAEAKAAEADARRAIALDPRNALALAACGHARAMLSGDHRGALNLHERARAAGPSHAIAWMLSSAGAAYVGDGANAVAYARHALRLSPFDQVLFQRFDFMAFAHYAAGDFEEAQRWARQAIDEQPGHAPSLRILAASSAAAGDSARAREAAEALLGADPGFDLAPYHRAHATFADPALQARWIGHLRAAGLPETPSP